MSKEIFWFQVLHRLEENEENQELGESPCGKAHMEYYLECKETYKDDLTPERQRQLKSLYKTALRNLYLDQIAEQIMRQRESYANNFVLDLPNEFIDGSTPFINEVFKKATNNHNIKEPYSTIHRELDNQLKNSEINGPLQKAFKKAIQEARLKNLAQMILDKQPKTRENWN